MLSRASASVGDSSSSGWKEIEIEVEPENSGQHLKPVVRNPEPEQLIYRSIPCGATRKKYGKGNSGYCMIFMLTASRLPKSKGRPDKAVVSSLDRQLPLQRMRKEPTLAPIEDICGIMFQDHTPGTSLGSLSEEHSEGNKYHVYIASDAGAYKDTCTKRLDLVLQHGQEGLEHLVLSRLDRLCLAVTLASSLLQLASKPWLQDQWRSNDIFLLMTGHGVVSSQKVVYPYVSRDISTAERIEGNKGKGKESTQLKTHLVRSEPLFALAQTLVELCFGTSLLMKRIPQDIDPEGREEITEMDTVRRLLAQCDIDNEFGRWYGDVVWTCLYCPFKERQIDFSNEGIVSAVCEDIVMQLANGLQIFQGSKDVLQGQSL